MKKYYRKLVRDNIPKLLMEDGFNLKVKVLNEEEFFQSLRKKLVEESKEVLNTTNRQDLLKELSDVYDVFMEILNTSNTSISEIKKFSSCKKQDKGSFKRKNYLIWTEDINRFWSDSVNPKEKVE